MRIDKLAMTSREALQTAMPVLDRCDAEFIIAIQESE